MTERPPLLFIMVMMLETLVEMEIPPEATPAEFSPPILAESGGVFVSVVFWSPSLSMAAEEVFI